MKCRSTMTARSSGLMCISASSIDRKSTRLNSSHGYISYAVFCLKKKKKEHTNRHTNKQTSNQTNQHTNEHTNHEHNKQPNRPVAGDYKCLLHCRTSSLLICQ